MAGTFGGALEARQIQAAGDRLSVEAVGEVEKEDKVLVLRRIHLRLRAPEEARATAERVHAVYAAGCPLFRSLGGSIAMSSELIFEPLDGPASEAGATAAVL
jgi:organic hydroperoxide reductase OsmC/OhrA